METTWEQVPGGKLKGTLILVVVILVVFIGVVASSLVKINGDQVGIVEKKLFGGDLPDGKILAVNGENGIQAQILAPGWHVKWAWQYKVKKEKMIEIKQGYLGLLQTSDGRSLPPGVIYAPEWDDPENIENMLNAA
jgi:uncharacterized membrane protein YqiK